MYNAYISVLSTNEYLAGALVVKKCLDLVKSAYILCILITPNITRETIDILMKNHIMVKPVEAHFIKEHKLDKWYFTFSKLNIFKQTQFKKCIYIDLDMVITENIDYLFNKPVLSAVNSGGFIYKTWTKLNSGLMVFEPSLELYEKCIEYLNDGKVYSGDQPIINKCFPDWDKKPELNLGYEYNMFVDDLHKANRKLGLFYITSMEEIGYDKKKDNIKVLHYINPKPWDKIKKTKAYKLWAEIYSVCKKD